MSCIFGRGKAIRAAGLEKPATGVASTWWPSTPSAKRPFAPANFQEATKNDWLHDSGDNYLDTHRIKWGVYAFYDYDGEPIYVGQTKESLGTRIRRHLTNQRTDSVAMSVLDPMEVHTVEVWPLTQFQKLKASNRPAAMHLNALEHRVFKRLLTASSFNGKRAAEAL